MVEIKQIKKTFGKLAVLKGIDASIAKGHSVSILGPNGSGKTTLIKSILGMTIPDSGEILIDGISVKNNWNYRKKIGYLPQIARFPENLTVIELIKMICDLRQSNETGEELISMFQLEPFLKKPLRFLSGGTRQKVNVILSLMFNADIYIFDEPTVGLDPVSRVQFREWVLKEKKANKTIILTTHLMNEVEEMTDEIIFLLEGVVHYHGSPKKLIEMYNETSLERAIAAMLVNQKK